MSLIGTLTEIKLADVFRLFASAKKSGVLTVSDGSTQALVRFNKGSIVHAMAGRLVGEAAVLDLFGWKQGQLTFVPEERSVTPNIVKDVDALILEGLRVGEALHRRRQLVPSDRVVFQLGPGPKDENRVSLGRTEWTIIRMLDGVADVGEMVESSGQPRDDVIRILSELAEAGFVERVETWKSLRALPQGPKGTIELDERLDGEWRKIARFANGVLRVEVRTNVGRTVPLGVSFKPGLGREAQLPRNVVGDFGLREGEEVQVRPIA